MDSDCVIVLTTLPADADAAAFARIIVDEQLAACVNVLPAMTSTYRWQGHVEEASERQVVMKTQPARVSALRERIQSLHSYEIPEFLVVPATGSEAYLKWIRESVSDPIDR